MGGFWSRESKALVRRRLQNFVLRQNMPRKLSRLERERDLALNERENVRRLREQADNDEPVQERLACRINTLRNRLQDLSELDLATQGCRALPTSRRKARRTREATAAQRNCMLACLDALAGVVAMLLALLGFRARPRVRFQHPLGPYDSSAPEKLICKPLGLSLLGLVMDSQDAPELQQILPEELNRSMLLDAWPARVCASELSLEAFHGDNLKRRLARKLPQVEERFEATRLEEAAANGHLGVVSAS